MNGLPVSTANSVSFLSLCVRLSFKSKIRANNTLCGKTVTNSQKKIPSGESNGYNKSHL